MQRYFTVHVKATENSRAVISYQHMQNSTLYMNILFPLLTTKRS